MQHARPFKQKTTRGLAASITHFAASDGGHNWSFYRERPRLVCHVGLVRTYKYINTNTDQMSQTACWQSIRKECTCTLSWTQKIYIRYIIIASSLAFVAEQQPRANPPPRVTAPGDPSNANVLLWRERGMCAYARSYVMAHSFSQID